MGRAAFLALAMALLAAGPAAAKKKFRHPLGFRVELPDNWSVEPAPLGATLAPPGVKVDPEREDNPEIYTLWAAEYDHSSEEKYIQALREKFKGTGVALERGGDMENVSTPGRPGVIYTFDFVHPDRQQPYRIRVYAMQHKGRSLLLIAQGERRKVAARDAVLRTIAKSVEW